ncbi:MAG: hypothetical protein AAF901_14770, partial [Bacteroidota bacterium]
MRYFLLLVALVFSLSDSFSQVGNFRTIASGTWSVATTWERDADQDGIYEESPSTQTPDNTSGTIEIQDGHTVTVLNSITIDETTIQSTGGIVLNDGFQFTAISLTINDGAGDDLVINGSLTLSDGFSFVGTSVSNNGQIVNTGTITINNTALSSITMNANSTYDHAQNGGSIPTSTWNATSTCSITGVTTTSPSNLGQVFGSLIWNTPLHAGGAMMGLTSNTTSVLNDFEIQSTGGALMFISFADIGVQVDISNNFTISGSSFVVFTNTGSIDINVGGDFDYSSLTPSFFTSNGTTNLNLIGNFSHTSGSLGVSGSGVGLINFEGSDTQT